jgi:hypothetical protein
MAKKTIYIIKLTTMHACSLQQHCRTPLLIAYYSFEVLEEFLAYFPYNHNDLTLLLKNLIVQSLLYLF